MESLSSTMLGAISLLPLAVREPECQESEDYGCQDTGYG